MGTKLVLRGLESALGAQFDTTPVVATKVGETRPQASQLHVSLWAPAVTRYLAWLRNRSAIAHHSALLAFPKTPTPSPTPPIHPLPLHRSLPDT